VTHTEWVLLAMLGLPIIYIAIDIILAVNKRKGDTYSEIIRAAGKKFAPLAMMISFGFGLLAGHWFW
jgi:hypothetical protein